MNETIPESLTCPHSDRIEAIETLIQPIKLVSWKLLTVIVILVGAACCWWLQTDFVTTKQYERDRNADHELLKEMRLDIKQLLYSKRTACADSHSISKPLN